MNSALKVSIVVPVYNVEKYIEECFDSILRQEYSNIEVILVDDGSMESSSKICDTYVQLDNRFCVIHTQNCGIASARNLAMKYMTGEYCFFLDPDDVLEIDSISYLVELIEKTDSDIALAVTRQFKGEYVPVEGTNVEEHIYDIRKDIIEKVLFDKGDVKPLYKKYESPKVGYEFFSSLYKTNQLVCNDIYFLPISYGEDTYVCFKSLLISKKVVTSTKVVYSHRKNLTSTTFQYHPELLEETSDYYKYYLELFEKYADEYISWAKEGLDGQYLCRCLTAMEGELFYSPVDKPIREKINTVRQIRKDKKFKELFTFGSMKYTSGKKYRRVLVGIKLGLYPIIVSIISIARRIKSK